MSLYNKIVDRQKLKMAWDKVKRNKPAAGVDEITYEEFEIGLKENLVSLCAELSSHTYEPLPVKLVSLYKGEKERKIALFAMRDKVVQQSIAAELVKIYDNHMSEVTYAYRPGRSALQAIDFLDKTLQSKKMLWMMKMDIESFFDNIILETLYSKIKSKLREEDVLELIRISCETSVLEKDGQLKKKKLGVYQGSAIAPVLSNIYLLEFDKEFAQKCKVFVRYSDDMLMLGESREELEKIYDCMKIRLQALGLAFNEKKIMLTETDKGLDFLGYHLSSQGKTIPAKAESNLSEKLEKIWFNEKLVLDEKLRKGAEILEGWEQYYRNERKIGSIQEYVVIIYCVRHKEQKILETLMERRKEFQNIYKEICGYLAKVWKQNGYSKMELFEFEDFYELALLDKEILIAKPESICKYYSELLVTESEETWTELMQMYSDVGAYNKAAKIMEYINTFHGKALKVMPNILQQPEIEESQIDFNSEFIHEYLRIFAGREDTYAKEELGYGRKRCLEQIPEPLTEEVIREHLLGKYTVSTYIQRSNQTVKYLVLDVDISKKAFLNMDVEEVIRTKLPKAVATVQVIMKILKRMGLKGYVEDSGFRGYHIWVFFTEWIPTRYAVMLAEVIESKLEHREEDVTIECFPNKGRIRGGSFGQSIKMPSGVHVRTGKKSKMLEEEFTPVKLDKEYLMDIAQFSVQAVKKIVAANSEHATIIDTKEVDENLEGFGEVSETVSVVLKRCNLMRYLCQKARKTGYLTHFERLSVLYVFGHLGEEGKTFVHTVMEFTLNYQYHVTEKFIQKLPAKPVSCLKLREQYKQITAEYGCSCNFKRTKNCYPSPVLHVIKSSGEVSEDITIPTSRTLSKEKEQKVVEEINIHKKVQELAGKIIEMKKQRRGVDKVIQRTELELEQIFNQAGINSLEVDMGVLVRRKTQTGYEWLIEI